MVEQRKELTVSTVRKVLSPTHYSFRLFLMHLEKAGVRDLDDPFWRREYDLWAGGERCCLQPITYRVIPEQYWGTPEG